MTTKQIEIFLEVSRQLNFTTAGEKLYMSQPTVSRQMQLLEHELGFPLFIRGNNFVRLTSEGLIMLSAFEKMLQIYESQKRMAECIHQGDSGCLTIGLMTNQNIPDTYFTCIDSFKKRYPNINLINKYIPFQETEEALQDHRMDMIFCHRFEIHEKGNFVTEKIATGSMGLYYSIRHPLGDRDSLKIKDFQNEKVWIIDVSDTEDRRKLIKKVTDFYGMNEFQTICAHDTNTLLFNLRLGNGISILDNLTFNGLPPDLKFLPFAEEVADVDLVLVWEKNNRNPAIPPFVELMKEIYRNNQKERY